METFLIGVAVGLVTAALIGGFKWLISRRSKAAQAEAEARERRAPVRAGLSAVASELRDCAHIARRCEEGQGHIPELVARLPIEQWAQRRGEMTPLRDEDKELWDELDETYSALRRSKESGGYPRKSDALLDLAARLEGRV